MPKNTAMGIYISAIRRFLWVGFVGTFGGLLL